jgi:hypothetical protein
MVKSALINNKYQKAFFPTMYEYLLKKQKMALRLASGTSKWGLGSDFPRLGRVVWEGDRSS